MKTYIILICGILFPLLTFTQTFNENQIDDNRLEFLILQKLNQHRQELNLKSLSSESNLQSAAKFHSKYQSQNNILTHDQDNEKYTTPYKRVLAFGGTNGLVGENVAYVSPKNTYEELAEAFYQGWKNSPPHYENMIHPDFRYSGIRFEISKDKKVIYGTHVLGGEMYIPPPVAHFPVGAYGVKEYNEEVCKPRQYLGRRAENMAGSLFTLGDSIFLYYRDEKRLMETIFKENDGLAVDIIERRQLPCDGPNLFHGSEIHDGMMLPPIYKKELFEKNKSPHYRGYKLFLGIVPHGIQLHFDLSMITIQEGYNCDYGYDIDIPLGYLSLFHINPIWAFAELKQRNYVDTILPLKYNEGWTEVKKSISFIKETKSFNVAFEKNKFQLNQLPSSLLKFLKKNKSHIKKIKIEAFSSVEGPTDRNLFLQKERAEKILVKLQKRGIPKSKITKENKENWDLFFAQINDTEWENWKDLPKTKIKELLKTQVTSDKIEPLLAQERIAKIIITFDNKIETESYSTTYFDDVHTSDNLKYLIEYFSQLVATNKTDSALLVQYDLIDNFLQKKISIEDIVEVDIPIKKENLPLLSNQLAVELFFQKSIRTDSEFIQKIKLMNKIGKDYLPMRFNFLGFATRYLYAAKDTLIDPIDLEFDIADLLQIEDYHTTYLDPIKTVERLQVNFHLGLVEYHDEIKRYELSQESLEFIKDYFIDEGLTELETIRLAIYFNRHGRSEWALELLFPYLEKGNYLENTLFTYIQTIPYKFYKDEQSKNRFIKYGQVAAKRNQSRFCNWFNSEFQLLRINEIKSLYCKTCE